MSFENSNLFAYIHKLEQLLLKSVQSQIRFRSNVKVKLKK